MLVGALTSSVGSPVDRLVLKVFPMAWFYGRVSSDYFRMGKKELTTKQLSSVP
jgi:hypothetical protein